MEKVNSLKKYFDRKPKHVKLCNEVAQLQQRNARKSKIKDDVMVQEEVMKCTKETVYENTALVRCQPDLLSEVPRCLNNRNLSNGLTNRSEPVIWKITDLTTECPKTRYVKGKTFVPIVAALTVLGTTCAVASYYYKKKIT